MRRSPISNPAVATYGVKWPLVFLYDDPNGRGYLRAIEPLTGQSKWAVPFRARTSLARSPRVARVHRPAAGEFMAVDADTGTILWEFQTSAGIVGQPITWERDGKQYVTVTSGATGPYVMYR